MFRQRIRIESEHGGPARGIGGAGGSCGKLRGGIGQKAPRLRGRRGDHGLPRDGDKAGIVMKGDKAVMAFDTADLDTLGDLDAVAQE